MVKPHLVQPKSIDEIAREWDAIAPVRAAQISSELDPSYDAVLVPSIMRLVGPLRDDASLLDVGCGTGALTSLLAPNVRRTVAIDPSVASLAQARRHAAAQRLEDTVEWHDIAVEQLASVTTERFDYIVANMTLMDAPDLGSAIRAISELASPTAIFVWSITHPWFWLRYWGYDTEPWFRYEQELFVEAEFKISNGDTGLTSTHVHRPMEQYIRELHEYGFAVNALEEPLPSDVVMARYPEPWRYPRFLAGRSVFCQRPT